MIELLRGYKESLTNFDDLPDFDSEHFIAIKKDYKEFYSEFCQTQIFRQFLQNDNEQAYPYFSDMENKLKTENKKNIFSKEYLENIQILNNSKPRRRSNSNENNFNITRLNSLYLTDENNTKFSGFDLTNDPNSNTILNTFLKRNLNNIDRHNAGCNSNSLSKNKPSIKIVDDYETIFSFKETYYLYPYFLDLNSKYKISLKQKSEFLMNLDKMTKYISSVFNDEDDDKSNNSFYKSNTNENKKTGLSSTSFNSNMQDGKEYNNNKYKAYKMLISDVNKRIFQNFRFLSMDKIPESFIRYSIPDQYNNVTNIETYPKKFMFNFRSIILEITKKVDSIEKEKAIKSEESANKSKNDNNENQDEKIINNILGIRKQFSSQGLKRKITINVYNIF